MSEHANIIPNKNHEPWILTKWTNIRFDAEKRQNPPHWMRKRSEKWEQEQKRVNGKIEGKTCGNRVFYYIDGSYHEYIRSVNWKCPIRVQHLLVISEFWQCQLLYHENGCQNEKNSAWHCQWKCRDIRRILYVLDKLEDVNIHCIKTAFVGCIFILPPFPKIRFQKSSNPYGIRRGTMILEIPKLENGFALLKSVNFWRESQLASKNGWKSEKIKKNQKNVLQVFTGHLSPKIYIWFRRYENKFTWKKTRKNAKYGQKRNKINFWSKNFTEFY